MVKRTARNEGSYDKGYIHIYIYKIQKITLISNNTVAEYGLTESNLTDKTLTQDECLTRSIAK